MVSWHVLRDSSLTSVVIGSKLFESVNRNNRKADQIYQIVKYQKLTAREMLEIWRDSEQYQKITTQVQTQNNSVKLSEHTHAKTLLYTGHRLLLGWADLLKHARMPPIVINEQV